MAISPSTYAAAADYRTLFSGTDTGQDADVLLDLEAVSKYIDSITGRFFGVDATATARVFIPVRNTSTLFVGDFSAAPTSLKIDTDNDGDFDDETAITGFESWPLNNDLNPEARPFHSVHLPSYASTTAFSAGLRVQVTAKWGWPAVPQAIKRATLQLTGILRMQSPRATNRYDEGVGSFIGASREARSIVQQIIDTYALKEHV